MKMEAGTPQRYLLWRSSQEEWVHTKKQILLAHRSNMKIKIAITVADEIDLPTYVPTYL